MATCFDRWEKDPFFPAAEEVQESADRMESVYRRWIYERKDASNPLNHASDLLLRELQTALGTAKWQLEELDRAVRSNDEACAAGEDTRTRHGQFVEAIGNQISTVENSLRELNQEKGETAHPWIRLDKSERDEFALFLSCPLPPHEKVSIAPPSGENPSDINRQDGVDLVQLETMESKEGKVHGGHRRTASACADIGVWKISVPIEEEPPNLPPPKISSFSCLAKALESSSKVKLPKNGFRKWKGGDQQQQDESETIPLHNHQLSRGCHACYERSKSCLSCCGDEAYEKQLYGWPGTLQRQLQRSQYQIQYGRPVQLVFWSTLVVFLIVFLAFHAI